MFPYYFNILPMATSNGQEYREPLWLYHLPEEGTIAEEELTNCGGGFKPCGY
jgi:hypothetical protein